jgi:aspartate dehydrogenase
MVRAARASSATREFAEFIATFSQTKLPSARGATAAFPRHFNVAITLSLGGIGFDDTEVDVIADGTIPGPVHHVEVEAEDADLTLISRNRAFVNPRTARLVAPSIVAALRGYVAPIRVGT